MFNVGNSGRRIVTESPSWKSRSLDLGNRHRTTLNFGDLVPAYWQHVQPGDKLRLDCSILAKFMPLIAPAFSRMRIKSEWFYVPLRQIAPHALRALQDFKIDQPSEVSEYFNKLMSGFDPYTPEISDNQQIREYSGFLSVPAWVLNYWLCGDTATLFYDVTETLPSASNRKLLGSDTPCASWRASVSRVSSLDDLSKLGYENITTYSTKKRCSKLMSYLGLPSRVTQMRYTSDVFMLDGSISRDLFSPLTDEDGNYFVHSYFGNSRVILDSYGVGYGTPVYSRSWMDKRYLDLTFTDHLSTTVSGIAFSTQQAASQGVFNSVAMYGYACKFPNFFSQFGNLYKTTTAFTQHYGANVGFMAPDPTTYSSQLVSMIPFQAYQKIFNDFYRDEKLQTDEVRYFPDAMLGSDLRSIVRSGSDAAPIALVNWYSPWSFVNNVYGFLGEGETLASFFNNLTMLRRRNRAKDMLSSSVTSDVVFGQIASDEGIGTVSAYTAKLASRIARFFMKKEFTGSTWAEWLNNFFGVNSNDLLNNNVVYLGGRESVVGISENIQQSSSTEDSAQGNRAGLAADFHNGNELYFRVPDFGLIMCIVSVIPDDLDNFNGLQERFLKTNVMDFNLPDFQNIGFAPVFNWRSNIGYLERDNAFTPPSGAFPKSYSSQNYFDSPANSRGVFGYQPFGYQHTYTPNLISGDLQNSLRYWHQSPDLDFDFCAPAYIDTGDSDLELVIRYSSWANSQLSLNANLPAIGLRQQPLGADLASQYYNNLFAVTNDESGDHIVADMRFSVTCHRHTAFFTDAVMDS